MNSNLKLLPAALLVAVLALAGCGGGSDSEPVDPGPTAEQKLIADLQAQIAALRTLLGLPADGDIGETVADLQAQLKELQDAKDAMDEKARMDAEAANMKTAMKLYAGINAPTGDAGTPAATDRAAAYNADGSAILVSIGDGTDTPADPATGLHTLSEDKKTMVAALHGWAGKRYADPAGGDMVEAMVYSNVEAPTQGKKFGSAAAVTPTGAYQYQLTNGELPSASFVAANVAFTGVTRTAGTETFHLPDPNPGGATTVLIPGSYHGVSGTYNCVPGTAADGCSAAVAAKGFTVSTTDAWTFTPANAEARVMDSADTAYASYGWWIRKAANDGDFTASAFHANKGIVDGTDNTFTGLDGVSGTATYSGGAAGKYALHSTTGGTNDAGHFTADAMLEANFSDDTITGTIDNFMGADGMARDWSVGLNKSHIGDGGALTGAAADGSGGNQMTVWTIGGSAAEAAGEWSGNLKKVDSASNVPTVATGTFYSEYGRAGKMVGAFGTNQQ